MEREIKKIKVCDCGAPLHGTLLYDFKEYFCMNCRNTYGMLGAGKNVPLTRKRKAREKVADDVFQALRKHLLGSGSFTRSKCKKCQEGKDKYHTDHLTKYEKAKNDEAKKILNRLKGYFKSK